MKLKFFNANQLVPLLIVALMLALALPALASVDPPETTPLDRTVTLCLDREGKTNPIVTVGLNSPGEAYVISCRIIAANGIFIRNAAEIGNQSVLDMGVIHA